MMGGENQLQAEPGRIQLSGPQTCRPPTPQARPNPSARLCSSTTLGLLTAFKILNLA